ncbi:hypothetical protein K438DRAFT_1761555 [Mycena galopus ATCC 62051]|nr:hypothetical protein K438DRAFT_1761555 [Mycena galopus ATCC 62051]
MAELTLLAFVNDGISTSNFRAPIFVAFFQIPGMLDKLGRLSWADVHGNPSGAAILHGRERTHSVSRMGEVSTDFRTRDCTIYCLTMPFSGDVLCREVMDGQKPDEYAGSTALGRKKAQSGDSVPGGIGGELLRSAAQFLNLVHINTVRFASV